MKKIMIQKITQNNWNFWTVNLIMRAKNCYPVVRRLVPSQKKHWYTQRICDGTSRYAVPARTVTKKALVTTDTTNNITNTHCHHDNFSPGSSDEVEKRRVTVDPQTKPIDLGREFAGRLLSSTLTTANPPLSITQPPNWYASYHLTQGRRLSLGYL